MRQLIRTFCVAAVIFAASLGCTKTAYITEDPPTPQEEVKPQAPGPKYSWVDGHWKWTGNRYVWVSGHWEKQKGNKTWVAGHWDKTPRGWRWVPGHYGK
jgi:hypothetical protein